MRTIVRNWKWTLPTSLVFVLGAWLIVPQAWAEETAKPKAEKAKKSSKEIEEARAKASKAQEDAQRKAIEAYEKRIKKEEEARKTDPAWKPSHQETSVIKINDGADKQVTLNSFCLNTDGNILACCSGMKDEIRVLSPGGKLLKTWPMKFTPEAICVADDGAIFVAGVGNVAKLDQDGKVLLAEKSPQMADMPPLPPLPDKKKVPAKEDKAAKAAKEKKIEELRAKAKKAQDEYKKKQAECLHEVAELLGVKTKGMTQQQIEEALTEKSEAMSGEEMVTIQKKFEAKAGDVAKKLADAQQELNEAIVTPEELAMQKRAEIQRKSTVTSIAVSKDDVFVVASMIKGYGYAVWRVDRNFSKPKRIIEGLSGCCGQMDAQAKDGEVWVAHNAAHKVERYDRDGKKLASFGKFGRKKAEEFGGCCEPKNLRLNAKGEVYASESGTPVVVKRFTADGKFLGVVGLPKYESGCVRVTIDVSRDGKQVFILDPGGDAIHVLTEKTAKPEKNDNTEKKPASKDT